MGAGHAISGPLTFPSITTCGGGGAAVAGRDGAADVAGVVKAECDTEDEPETGPDATAAAVVITPAPAPAPPVVPLKLTPAVVGVEAAAVEAFVSDMCGLCLGDSKSLKAPISYRAGSS